MTWRSRLRAAADRVTPDTEIEWSRKQKKHALLAWVVTAVAVPLAALGSGFVAGAAWGSLIGLWIGGAYQAWRDRGEITIIKHD